MIICAILHEVCQGSIIVKKFVLFVSLLKGIVMSFYDHRPFHNNKIGFVFMSHT